MLNTQVLGIEFDAKVRHFPNALSDALFGDAMPESVYRQLVAQGTGAGAEEQAQREAPKVTFA